MTKPKNNNYGNKSQKYKPLHKNNNATRLSASKIDDLSFDYLNQLLNNCYNYNKQLFKFKNDYYKKITGTNWVLAYNNYIGYPVLFYNDNNVDLLSFDNISHYIKELIDINYINIDDDLQEFLNIELSQNDSNITSKNYDLLSKINIFAEFTFENNQIKPSAILQ